eukprot:764525-Rhodomonas_salina.1
MEKVVYHYDGETARLLDVTREKLHMCGTNGVYGVVPDARIRLLPLPSSLSTHPTAGIPPYAPPTQSP